METPALNKVIGLFRANKLNEAKEACLTLLSEGHVEKEPLYLILLELANIQADYTFSLNYYDHLIGLFPDELTYYLEKADLLRKLGKPKAGIQCYEQLLARKPSNANARYNFALFLKKEGQSERAIANYLRAIEFHISEPQEVYLNIGVIYSELHDTDNAIKYYSNALTINSHYVPALYNLGGIYEELGKKEIAVDYYMQILALEPSNINALSRLVYAKSDLSLESEEVQKLKSYTDSASYTYENFDTLETALFALGKVYDERKVYPKAFYYYKKGNELGDKRITPYKPNEVSGETKLLTANFTKPWYQNSKIDNDYEPIFVCGMFRSGSTLVESILSEHPQLCSGGEISLLNKCINDAKKYSGSLSPSDYGSIAENYKKQIGKIFGTHNAVVDKSLDNFKNIGLIKAIFPKAKIICTDRNPLDICISIYFQQLGSSLNYSTELRHIAHYYIEYKKTLKHWLQMFPGEIFLVNYEQLVENPTGVCARLFYYCDLEWRDIYLDFYKSNKLVKTASIWQVRQPLQKLASRSQNYKSQIREIEEMLAGHY
ncbi:tetratricopeptide repeat-containing sulfotransferase family protein [Paraglaciecola sp. L1A13]|uniref:tetratricopeptide repeat-containing sulfotransferase family protein n=1 Tax=Paraglaciecola sp. L1A13 TaxID=2686359 RepID=UPI00131E3CA8|nr:tetratricopeptide repeat-containing sulfotransferase family protein [Paraglaciecola sp. L1A13]